MNHEKIEKEVLGKYEKKDKKSRSMKVSGKMVFKLQKLIKRKKDGKSIDKILLLL